MLDLKQFHDVGQEIANHPFLKDASKGTLPLEKWARYFSARLDAGPSFVTFLRNLQSQAAAQGERGLHDAALKNMNEELGIVNGITEPGRAHAEWRSWFRGGIKRVLEQRNVPLPDAPPADFTEVHGYPEGFRALNEQGDVLESSGALGVLEIGLGMEYVEVIKGLETMGIEMTPKEWTYLRSHAIHDARHFEEIFRPLAEACKTVNQRRRVERGIELARDIKLGFLDGANRSNA